MTRSIRTLKTKTKTVSLVETPSVILESAHSENVTSSTPTKPTKWVATVVLLSGFLIAAISIGGYFYYQYQKTPVVAQARELSKLTKKLGAYLSLPEGETPTLATVADREKLADQPFFRQAENGDKVLIYSSSGKAILYRPSIGKVVDMTTVKVQSPANPNVMIGAPGQSSQVAGETTGDSTNIPVTPIKTVIYRGSDSIGSTLQVEQSLESLMPAIDVIERTEAAQQNYTRSIVIDIGGDQEDIAKKVAALLGADVGALPSGETLPDDADLLIIVGGK